MYIEHLSFKWLRTETGGMRELFLPPKPKIPEHWHCCLCGKVMDERGKCGTTSDTTKRLKNDNEE